MRIDDRTSDPVTDNYREIETRAMQIARRVLDPDRAPPTPNEIEWIKAQRGWAKFFLRERSDLTSGGKPLDGLWEAVLERERRANTPAERDRDPDGRFE